MKKRILACLLALVMLIGVLPVMALAEDSSAAVSVPAGKAKVGSSGFEGTLDEAMAAAEDGDTIYLGKGTYCGNAENPTEQNPALKFGESGKEKMKSLTFVGAGTGETTWQIRAPENAYGADGYCDYSFKGSDSITFQNMTVIGSVYPEGSTKWAPVWHNDTQGLTYINHITLKNCIFNGRADYWGYVTTTFENVTFNAPGTEASGIPNVLDVDYSLWTYTGKSYTFKNCTFNSAGKTVNVYRHWDSGYDITVNFENCKAINTGISLKPVLSINDSTLHDKHNEHKYLINISGDNSVSGVDADNITCSRLFGFGGKPGNNTKRTIVNIEGTTVWKDGERVSHSMDITGGSYDDGVAEGTANKYTEGYKDNAFKILEATDWEQQSDGSYERKVTRKCKYCGYTEIVKEVKKDDIVDIIPVILPAISKNETAPKLNTRDHFAYVQGYPDGTVKPAGSITRAEVAAILFRLMDADSRSLYYSTASGFRDVDSTKWYNTYVATLNNAGVITDSRTGYFRPNDAITRAELAAMLAQFAEKKSAAIYFSDISAGYWAANAIALTANLGWINGYPDGTFGPDKTVTRAELMAMVNRATGRAPESADALLPNMKTWKDNADTARWYYLDVQEATNSHTYLGAPTETWTSLTSTPDWSQYE